VGIAQAMYAAVKKVIRLIADVMHIDCTSAMIRLALSLQQTYIVKSSESIVIYDLGLFNRLTDFS